MNREGPWPKSPTGIRSVGQLYDGDIVDLADSLRDDEGDWFEQISPPSSPGPWEDMAPDYDHDSELAAAPDNPTEEYRKKALEYVEAVIAAREDVRPSSLRLLEELPTGIVRIPIGGTRRELGIFVIL